MDGGINCTRFLKTKIKSTKGITKIKSTNPTVIWAWAWAWLWTLGSVGLLLLTAALLLLTSGLPLLTAGLLLPFLLPVLLPSSAGRYGGHRALSPGPNPLIESWPPRSALGFLSQIGSESGVQLDGLL